MSESHELDRIRERKREELERRLQDGETASPADVDEPAADVPDEPIHVHGTDELTDAVARYDVVLVDFYADWCGPCKMLEPIVADVAAETDAVVAKVDIDANRQLASQYGVRGVPTLILFADAEAVKQLVGVQDRNALTSLVDQYDG